jgi:hypothetical protein
VIRIEPQGRRPRFVLTPGMRQNACNIEVFRVWRIVCIWGIVVRENKGSRSDGKIPSNKTPLD